MLSSQSLNNKQEKTAQSPQSFQNKNEGLNSFQEDFQHSTIHSTQLKENNFLNGQNQKLLSIQSMAIQSPFNAKITQLKHLANGFDQQKQSVFQLKKNGTGLPDQLKSGVENLSGISMNDVKVHYNSDKPAQLNAHAYAQGTDIHIASGQEKHLPHEAWHVVQQKQGRVQPTAMMKAKVPINDDQSLEKEADIMGTRALQMKPFSLSDYRTEKMVQKKGIIQREGGENVKEKPKQIKSSKENESGIPSQNQMDKGFQADFENRDAIGSLDELDKDLSFKASDGIEDVTATDIELPKHKGITKAFHTTTNKYAANSILQRIDPRFHNPASRFGGGFYAASDLETSYAEVAAHEFDNFKPGAGKESEGLLSAVHTIEYAVNGGELVDCTDGKLSEIVKSAPMSIEKKVREDKKDGIVFPSTKGSGMNIVLFQNYGILKPKSEKPESAKEGFEQYKKEKLSGKIDKLEKNGELSNIKNASDTGNKATI